MPESISSVTIGHISEGRRGHHRAFVRNGDDIHIGDTHRRIADNLGYIDDAGRLRLGDPEAPSIEVYGHPADMEVPPDPNGDERRRTIDLLKRKVRGAQNFGYQKSIQISGR